MSDPIQTAVDELRAACKATKAGRARSTVSADIEPHGVREVSVTVAPMAGEDDRWFLEVSMRRGGDVSQQWLEVGPRERVLELLAAPDIVERIAAVAKKLADADFHTEGLPERW